MKKDLVVGLGEIGLPIYNLFSKSSITDGFDINPKLIHEADLKGIYFEKMVDLKTSAKFARDQIWGIRKSIEFKNEAKRVYLKHGSRRRRNFKSS